MLFNSFEFLLFFPLVCIVYFLLRKRQIQNTFLLISSYYFYMNWKPVYAILILASTIITFFSGCWVEKLTDIRKRKYVLWACLILNLGILFIFKYFNFINESVFQLLDVFGMRWKVPNLDVLLPVGISFYTFQAIGYSIDVYKGTIKAERDFFTYALFVSFFPQLVAGPIERAKNLLPQFHEQHFFNSQRAIDGFKQMLWGFFMKLCVADMLGNYVDAVYNNVSQHNGTSILLATVFFTFQIYCDFGGYSNIAIGAAKVMGFKLMENFRRPYLSQTIKEFWKRWHISLSTWFMDYVYIPLGGNRVKYSRHLFNLMVTFMVSGLWHGANWTFVIWGALHGCYQVIGNVFRKYVYKPKYESVLSKVAGTLFCFVLVSFAWLFFRANNVADAFDIVNKIITERGTLFVDQNVFVVGFMSLLILMFKDIKDQFELRFNFLHSKFCFIRYASIIALTSYVLLFGALSGGQFIYFQF